MYHYVYRITNKAINKHYYGSRTSKLHPKDDLGHKYFSSSKDKEFIKEQKFNPSIFKYKVVKICETRDEATSIEILLHKRFNVALNESFYNKANQTSKGFLYGMIGKSVSDENKAKSKERMLGDKNPMYNIGDNHPIRKKGGHSDITKLKISESRLKKGIKHSDEYKNKMSERCKGINKGDKNPMFGKHLTDEQKQHLRDITTGIKRSNETRQKIKESALNRADYNIVCCPHCGKEGKENAMKRWHFDRCIKVNPDANKLARERVGNINKIK